MKDRASVEDLVAAMIRFNEGAGHPPLGTPPPGASRIGEDCFVFSPAYRRVMKSELTAYLESLTSPVLLSQSTQRGIINLTPLNEVAGDRRNAMEHGLENQTALLENFVQQYCAADSDLVALEFDEESIEFRFGVLREWAKRFILNVGWSLSKAEKSTPPLRLNLIRADRVKTKHFGVAEW